MIHVRNIASLAENYHTACGAARGKKGQRPGTEGDVDTRIDGNGAAPDGACVATEVEVTRRGARRRGWGGESAVALKSRGRMRGGAGARWEKAWLAPGGRDCSRTCRGTGGRRKRNRGWEMADIFSRPRKDVEAHESLERYETPQSMESSSSLGSIGKGLCCTPKHSASPAWSAQCQQSPQTRTEWACKARPQTIAVGFGDRRKDSCRLERVFDQDRRLRQKFEQASKARDAVSRCLREEADAWWSLETIYSVDELTLLLAPLSEPVSDPSAEAVAVARCAVNTHFLRLMDELWDIHEHGCHSPVIIARLATDLTTIAQQLSNAAPSLGQPHRLTEAERLASIVGRFYRAAANRCARRIQSQLFYVTHPDLPVTDAPQHVPVAAPWMQVAGAGRSSSTGRWPPHRTCSIFR
ncbi:hypothetical protein GGX14DRAFT_398854 [Mycena pura]|uniref:Uncharacterized protein n=1 Tax=Mycena pura TaxID=153505 RepID=A0AAD6Y603_9AGAR|nr:hypothetical protein GGX14DRAFT_398854 [Mycena pura]